MCEGARAGLAPPALAVDALTHEQDIRAALGLEPAAAAEEIRFCTGVYCAGFARSVGGAGLPAVTIAASDSDFTQTVGAGEVTATVRAPEFELFRALSGRRSREQILAYDWTGDAASYVEHFGRFGHLATTAVTG
jgi:hypothetical protein